MLWSRYVLDILLRQMAEHLPWSGVQIETSSLICVKTFSTCASAKKWKKVGKSGKLAHFGKCDKGTYKSEKWNSANLHACGAVDIALQSLPSLLTLASHSITIHYYSLPVLFTAVQINKLGRFCSFTCRKWKKCEKVESFIAVHWCAKHHLCKGDSLGPTPLNFPNSRCWM